MNLHLLKLFVHAVQENSFTRAAEKLNLTQPAISRGVRELEDQVEAQLLERRGKYFQPTEAGKLLYEYGRSILALQREAGELLRAFKTLERGRLVIGASTTVATYWLPPVIAQILKSYPGLDIQLKSANTDTVHKWLIDCEVDVAVVEGLIEDPQIEISPWREEDMILIAPSSQSLSASNHNLEQSLWIVREPGSGSREAANQALSKMEIGSPRMMELNSNEAIIQCVASGCGIGVVPKITVRDALALGRVQRLRTPGKTLKRTLYRLRLPHRPQSNAALAFEAALGQSNSPK